MLKDKIAGVLAAALLIGAAALALFVGGYLLFFGCVEAAKADPVDSAGLAWGIIRIIAASPVGGLIFWIPLFWLK